MPLSSFSAWFSAEEEYQAGDWFKVELGKLRPTQLTIGQREVDYRVRKLRRIFSESNAEDRKKYLKKKAGAVILGPEGSIFVVDGHHHARALWELGRAWTYAEVEKNWSHLSWDQFWLRMGDYDRVHHRPRLYLKDASGRQRTKDDLPKTLAGLRNDPLRSIVFFLVRLGIIRKAENFPYYGEYRIVEYLRGKIELKSPSGRWRYWNATRDAAYLVSRWSNQDLDLPGQHYLTKKVCKEHLAGLGKYLDQ